MKKREVYHNGAKHYYYLYVCLLYTRKLFLRYKNSFQRGISVKPFKSVKEGGSGNGGTLYLFKIFHSSFFFFFIAFLIDFFIYIHIYITVDKSYYPWSHYYLHPI